MRSSSTLSAFPQPTRPSNSYNLDSSSQILPPTTAYPYEQYSDQCFHPVYEKAPETASTAAMDPEMETVEELVRKINELYQKLPESIKSQVRFDINVPSEMMRDLRVASIKSRDIEGSSFEQLSSKLERFKIRTVQVGGGIITDDDGKNNQDVK